MWPFNRQKHKPKIEVLKVVSCIACVNTEHGRKCFDVYITRSEGKFDFAASYFRGYNQKVVDTELNKLRSLILEDPECPTESIDELCSFIYSKILWASIKDYTPKKA